YGPSHKIGAPADTAVKLAAYRIRSGLACQVYLKRGIDCGHIVVLCDDEGVVCIADPLKFDERIVVDIPVSFLFTHAEGRNGLPSIDLLFRIIDYPLRK